MSATTAANNGNNTACNSANTTTTAKVLKSSSSLTKSPNSSKHGGPMKATIPMSSLLKQSSPLRSSVSPTLAPWKPADVQSGLRSPGSSINKVKMRNKTGALNCIRRSASLDAIYLQGQWPRENIYVPHLLQVDKATQTDELEWNESRKMMLFGEPAVLNDTNSNGSEKLEKFFRPKVHRCNTQHSTNRSQISSPTGNVPIVGDHTLNTSSQTNTFCLIPRAMPVNIPIKPLSKPTMRNSVEGLNQEIERLVLKSDSFSNSTYVKSDEFDKVTPEGHRAPFPEMYRNTRSVNTQTPSANDLRGSCHSSGPSSRDSVSPLMIPGLLDTSPSEAGGSRGSSPDQETSPFGKMGTSPRIFLARGPPDGCERVNLRMESKHAATLLPPAEHNRLSQPSTAFKLQPSQGSAFQLLQPASAIASSINQTPQQQEPIPIVPDEEELMQ